MEIKSFIKSLTIIHLFLLIGLTIVTLWVFLRINSIDTSTEGQELSLYLAPIFAMIGYFGSIWVFKKMTSNIKLEIRLEEKLKKYQSALLIKYVLIETPAYIGLFTYYNTANALPLVISVCLLAYLAAQRPNKANITNNIPLKAEEKEQIQQS